MAEKICTVCRATKAPEDCLVKSDENWMCDGCYLAKMKARSYNNGSDAILEAIRANTAMLKELAQLLVLLTTRVHGGIMNNGGEDD